jgi:hypothetical protein
MFDVGRIYELLSRAFKTRGSKSILLSDSAQRVLREAEARNYQVTRSTRQGPEAIVLQRGGEGAVHLWSNEDVIEYGRSRGWI